MSKIGRREFLKYGAMSAAAIAAAPYIKLNEVIAKHDKRPNIVIILVDDMGYADLGCFGAKGYTTPNLDQMAKDGMRFTNFYVSQGVCSASRASLLTGCYAERVGIRNALTPNSQIGISAGEETIAQLLKKRGYKTGIFGKWHLGHYKEFLPLQHGFDEYFGLPYSNDMIPVNYDGSKYKEGDPKAKRYPPLPLIEGNETVKEITTLEDLAPLTTLYTERAVKFIEKNKDNPFFLYVPHTMPHTPLAVSDKFKGKSEQGPYGDVAMELDWSAGEIIKALKKNGLENNTLVIFTSDNGPWLNFGKSSGSACPLREGKGTAFEGGARVPAVMYWPGVIPADKTCDNISSTIDILPTVSAITGMPLPKNKIDGINILPLLKGNFKANPRNSFVYYYDYELRGVREGEWKVIYPHKTTSYEGMEPGANGMPGPTHVISVPMALYNLNNDIGEQYDVKYLHPEIVSRLDKIAEKYRIELGDNLNDRVGKEVRGPGRRKPANSQFVKHLAIGSAITLVNQPAVRYSGNGAKTLIDGVRGSYDYTDQCWLGFEGSNLIANIDLGKLKKLHSVSCGFLQSQISWVFLPSYIKIEVSKDGKEFLTAKEWNIDPKEDNELKVADFKTELNDIQVRYIRVTGKNIEICPQWHIGKGGKAWLFADEIVVN